MRRFTLTLPSPWKGEGVDGADEVDRVDRVDNAGGMTCPLLRPWEGGRTRPLSCPLRGRRPNGGGMCMTRCWRWSAGILRGH